MIVFKTKKTRYEIIQEGPQKIFVRDDQKLGPVTGTWDIEVGKRARVDYVRQNNLGLMTFVTCSTDYITEVECDN